jgi:hypothetical protein
LGFEIELAIVYKRATSKDARDAEFRNRRITQRRELAANEQKMGCLYSQNMDLSGRDLEVTETAWE